VTDKDRAKVTPAVDATGLELLEPSSSRAQHKQGKVLDGEVIIRPPGLHGEAIVLKLMVWVGLAIILRDVSQRPEPPRVGCNTPGVYHQLSRGFKRKHDRLSVNDNVKVNLWR
jgi:hypothetical protein